MKRHIFSLFLLATCMMMFGKSFDYTYKNVKFKCKIEGGNNVKITSFTYSAPDVVIPAKVQYDGKEYNVRIIDTNLNGVNYCAKTIVVENGVQEISNFAFNDCRNLESITVPKEIVIGSKAYRSQVKINRLNVENRIEGPSPNISKGGETPTPTPTPTPTIVSVSDVDVDIPVTNIDNENTYCIIFANENYINAPKVEWALNDGSVFREYCKNTLGVNEKRIKYYPDATFGQMQSAFDWMKQTSNINKTPKKFIIYYTGHGSLSEEDGSSLLIPTDINPKIEKLCINLNNLYADLGKMNSLGTTVILDACFSGESKSKDNKFIVPGQKSITTAPKKSTVSGNVVVFSAVSKDEKAFPYMEQSHSMFTYFLLKELKKTKGDITFGKLFDAVYENVKQCSWDENERLQTPSVGKSQTMEKKWRTLKFY